MTAARPLLYAFCALELFVCLAAGAAHAAEDERAAADDPVDPVDPVDPAELVARMSVALRTLEYEGTLVNLSRGSLTSMHVLHASDTRGELERLLSLDGEAREVIRDHELVTCIWPASSSVVITQSKPRTALPDIDESLASNENYALRLAPPDRIAGLPTHVVDIDPLDALRYGYRFWIDQVTYMLLRSVLVDEHDRALEQVMFTAIEYPDRIDRSRFDVVVSRGHRSLVGVDPDALAESLPSSPIEGGGAGAGGLAGLHDSVGDSRGVSDDGQEQDAAGSAGSDRVTFDRLPAGFAKISETYRPMLVDKGPVSHAVISDGVASVSVYVEHVGVDRQDTDAAGLSSMGAMNVWGRSLDEGFVTVVGEVPSATVEAIAAAARLR